MQHIAYHYIYVTTRLDYKPPITKKHQQLDSKQIRKNNEEHYPDPRSKMNCELPSSHAISKWKKVQKANRSSWASDQSRAGSLSCSFSRPLYRMESKQISSCMGNMPPEPYGPAIHIHICHCPYHISILIVSIRCDTRVTPEECHGGSINLYQPIPPIKTIPKTP